MNTARFLHHFQADGQTTDAEDVRRLGGCIEHNAMVFADNGFGEFQKVDFRHVARWFESQIDIG